MKFPAAAGASVHCVGRVQMSSAKRLTPHASRLTPHASFHWNTARQRTRFIVHPSGLKDCDAEHHV
ncbi:hypothetical protein EYF80_017694 [Liparis tanakae]|uniref:Uncharacterized protein n=1 Tax=Liparis tanakae TaxID=230148 RepID=A0A4Z2I298_9TELE|nr:hypothetical protein EYF80_017694 [Liparis tanakae]